MFSTGKITHSLDTNHMVTRNIENQLCLFHNVQFHLYSKPCPDQYLFISRVQDYNIQLTNRLHITYTTKKFTVTSEREN